MMAMICNIAPEGQQGSKIRQELFGNQALVRPELDIEYPANLLRALQFIPAFDSPFRPPDAIVLAIGEF